MFFVYSLLGSCFRCWKGKFLLSKEFWRFGRQFPCVLWTIWQERNGRDFGGVDRTNNVIKQMMLRG